MKTIFLIVTMSLGGWSTASARLSDEWPTIPPATAGALDQRIDKMLTKVARHKNESSDREILYSIFRKTQKEFLHRYKPYADLGELANGDFDCLTATSLFAAVLTRAGFEFRIIETNYHIFLMVSTTSGEVLLETTDRFSGFVATPEEIAKKVDQYRAQSPQVSDKHMAYQYDFEVFGEIEAAQLTGLLYFNQAVKAYNEGKWLACSEKIAMAGERYESPRINALASVLLYTISISDLPETEKQSVRSNLKSFDSTYPLASR